MGELVPNLFSYNDLDKEDVRFLKEKSGAIKSLARSTSLNLIHIGNHLLDVRDKCKLLDLSFSAWVESEFSWDRSYAYRMMQVAQSFSSVLQNINELFDPSAMIMLSQSKTPKAARDYAIELATSGEHVSHAKAKEIISGLGKSKQMPREEVTLFSKFRSEMGEMCGEAEEAKEIRKGGVDRPFNDAHAELYESFKLAMESFDVIHFSRMNDTEGESAGTAKDGTNRKKVDDNRSATSYEPVTCWGLKRDTYERKSYFSSNGLDNLIREMAADILGNNYTKKCFGPLCNGKTHPYSAFQKNQGTKTGVSSRCKRCEAERQRLIKLNKKGSVGPVADEQSANSDGMDA